MQRTQEKPKQGCVIHTQKLGATVNLNLHCLFAFFSRSWLSHLQWNLMLASQRLTQVHTQHTSRNKFDVFCLKAETQKRPLNIKILWEFHGKLEVRHASFMANTEAILSILSEVNMLQKSGPALVLGGFLKRLQTWPKWGTFVILNEK